MKLRKVLISVTKNDIEKGEPSSYSRCPVSRAIKNKLDRDEIAVDANYIELLNDSGGVEYIIKTPKEVAKFIDKFDSSMPVAPFKFAINVPTKR